MKKIIDGKLYSTDNTVSKLLGSYQYGDERNRNYFQEELYKTNNENFFLHGSGGPDTEYRGREDIYALEPDEARGWAEKHLNTERYSELFPDTETA